MSNEALIRMKYLPPELINYILCIREDIIQNENKLVEHLYDLIQSRFYMNHSFVFESEFKRKIKFYILSKNLNFSKYIKLNIEEKSITDYNISTIYQEATDFVEIYNHIF